MKNKKLPITNEQYTALHCHSYYSLLDGASSPEALVARAVELGLTALALTDHDSLAGAVRFGTAARAAGLQPIFGAELTLADDSHLTVLAETQDGYANICRLLTHARLGQIPEADDSQTPAAWPGKVTPRLDWDALHTHRHELIVLSGCRRGPVLGPLLRGRDADAYANIDRLRELFGPQHLFVEVQHHALPDDDRLMRRALALAAKFELPVVATNNVHYANTDASRLRDALIAIANHVTLDQAQHAGYLPANSRYALAAPAEMARTYRSRPDALHATQEIARRCHAVLDFSAQRIPAPPIPAEHAHLSSFAYLYQLCHENLPRRYPTLTPAVLKQLAHELDVIEHADLAGYFLMVWDIVRYAKTTGVRCQGRGSAANSIVAYLLGITSIDPLQHNLLFERFLSTDKFTTPDIDIDFAADRREEVIQYVYRRYGRAHTAMVCNTVTYRARSAIRELSAVLDFPEPVIDRLLAAIDTHSPTEAAAQIEAQFLGAQDADLAPRPGEPSGPLATLTDLLRRIDGCPRHLSIHSGGMLITAQPLETIVPLEPATMPGRFVCQWDKDSVEDAGLIKIDLLGLRTLGLISEALGYIEASGENVPDLDALPLDDPAIFAMLHRADTIGAFQVESRAQQQMLPRLKPACFEEIAIEVAIVRPGPIQGGAVHPYLRRHAGVEPVSYLHPCLEPVLAETKGVLLFQEQAIRVAVVAAGFAPGEADMLRRAMSRSRSDEAMAAMRLRFLEGAARNGIDYDTAAAIFGQLAGFAGYGFCKSHAASFALIAYQTLYLKHYHPAAFYCALLNQQPMGFYSPEVVVNDARRHGVDLRPVEINRSGWGYQIETEARTRPALRTGLSAVHGMGEHAWTQVEAARQERPFTDLRDVSRRARLDRDTLSNLIRAGALDAFGARRALLWELGDIDDLPGGFALDLPTIQADLPQLPALEQTAWEYELLGLSAAGQVMTHYRATLRRHGVLSTWQAKHTAEPGQRVCVAGLVVVRQRPGTAKGILFMSLEDESGLLDLVVKPQVYARLRTVLRSHALLLAAGIVQREGRATSVLVHDAVPLQAHGT